MGTMRDFEVVAALDEHGIGVMLDMVLNHTSTQHVWFQRALAGDPDYQDFYYIRPAGPNGETPNNWVSKFGGSAWAPFTSETAATGITEDEASKNGVWLNYAGPGRGNSNWYYLHLYDVTQADLNWHNSRVREEMAKIVSFWHKKGVKGFRFDVINVIGKPLDLASAPQGVDDRTMYTDGPDVIPFLQEIARTSFGQDPQCVTVGEMSSTSIEQCILYTAPQNNALSMAFNFHHLKVDYQDGRKWTRAPFDFAALKEILSSWAEGMQAGDGWNALFWNNHDQPRALNRYADVSKRRVEAATMLATSIHLMRGTPYVSMGEEIGMIDPEYDSIEDYRDVEALNAFAELTATGMSADEAFSIVASKARDNSRTPMQWDDTPNAGFSSGTAWLRPTSHARINVLAEEKDGRILPYYRRLIALRKKMSIISEGSFAPYALNHPHVFAFTRSHERRQLLVLNNFYGVETQVTIPEHFVNAEVLISNDEEAQPPSTTEVTLRPYQSLAILV